MVRKKQNSFLTKSNFSNKNVAGAVWEWSDWERKTVIGKDVWNSLSYWSINSIYHLVMSPGMPKLHLTRWFFQTALTLKGHHHFHNFTVLFQLHIVEIHINHKKITFLTEVGIKCCVYDLADWQLKREMNQMERGNRIYSVY
jgi:hypothetical protein